MIKFNFAKMLAYPWEMVAFFASRIVELCFLIIFWYAVSRSNSGIFSFRQITAYFLVVSAVRDLSLMTNMRLGREIKNNIKSGELNNALIKPVKIIPFLLAVFAGENGLMFLYAAAALVIGIIVFPPAGILNLALFFIFLTFALLLSLSINIYAGMAAFYSPETEGLLNILNSVIKILSGALIPINYFPRLLKKIILLTPFPGLAFTPAFVLQNKIASNELLKFALIGIFWTFFLLASVKYFWKKSLRNYEGIGI